MDRLQDLFEHELEDIYYAEHKLVTALGEMVDESSDPAVKKAFAEHRTQTEEHVRRLDQVFTTLGQKPHATTCEGIEGLIKEKKSFSKEKPTSTLLDLYNLGAGAKSERYEISAYEGLIDMAQQLGLGDVQYLLDQNLAEEEQALATVKNLAKTATQKGSMAPR
jgi:ferritin-like metal-binding protein YciE